MGMHIKKVGVNEAYVITLGAGDITLAPCFEFMDKDARPVLWIYSGRNGCQGIDITKPMDVDALPVLMEFSNLASLDGLIDGLEKLRTGFIDLRNPADLIEYAGQKYRDQLTITTPITFTWWQRICNLFAARFEFTHVVYVKQPMPAHRAMARVSTQTYWDQLVAFWRKDGAGMTAPVMVKERTLTEREKNVLFTTATIKDTDIGPWLRLLTELEAQRKGIPEDQVNFKYSEAMAFYDAHYTPYQTVRKLFKD